MRQIIEREDKWDVDDRFVVPDLDRIVDGATVRHDTVDLISTYYDTPERDLQACGIGYAAAMATTTPAGRSRSLSAVVAAGARRSRYPSKLAHAVPARGARRGPARSSALTEYLNAQIDRIIAGDLGLRRHQDPIHDTRVAIRRLRSTLRVFGAALDQADVGDIDGELKWFAGLLGEVRDCQVQQRRFTDALDGFPDDLILGPVWARICSHLQSIELPARTRVAEAMTGDRYLALMSTLRRWRTESPLVAEVTVAMLRTRARKAAHKADKRLASGLESGDGAQLHRARKAAKRARYAAELLKPVASKKTERKAKHYKRIQSVLGDHQDTVVARAALRRLGTTAGTTAGENGFTFGLLYAREHVLARRSRRAARTLR
jgi:CHAD domain-containing protein